MHAGIQQNHILSVFGILRQQHVNKPYILRRHANGTTAFIVVMHAVKKCIGIHFHSAKSNFRKACAAVFLRLFKESNKAIIVQSHNHIASRCIHIGNFLCPLFAIDTVNHNAKHMVNGFAVNGFFKIRAVQLMFQIFCRIFHFGFFYGIKEQIQ